MATIFGHAFGESPDLFGPIFGPIDASGGGADPLLRATSGVLVLSPRATGELAKIGGVMNQFYRGESTTLVVTVKVDGIAVAIDAGDHTVSAIEYTLRSGLLEDAGAVALTKTLGAGIEHSGDVGEVEISIDTADTAALTPGLYYEQVAVVFADDPGEWVFVVPPQRRVVYGAVKVPS